jgi:hypothetical protein
MKWIETELNPDSRSESVSVATVSRVGEAECMMGRGIVDPGLGSQLR